jgi:beta-ribofuranosylaminobenzene 5'-phosphate synthase
MDETLGHSQPTVITVSTGSRLHFGLFDVKSPFGGVGVMVDHPHTMVSVSHADQFSLQPCDVDRIREIAKRLTPFLPQDLIYQGLPRCLVTIESAAEPHCGLGSGTQLSLAATMAMVHWFGLSSISRDRLISEIASRGRRSSIGSLGFFEGGLIAEDGTAKSYEDQTAWNRVEVPEGWRIVLAYPEVEVTSVSGEAEGAAFAALPAATPAYRAQLAELGREIIAHASAGSFKAFSQTITRFNRLSGELFASHQGGCYNGLPVASLVEQIRNLGVEGVGQSSWGPTVFAFCESADKATHLTRTLPGVSCRIVKPLSSGYSLVRSPSTSCK